MTTPDTYQPCSGPLWDESVQAVDEQCAIGSERYCCDGRCNENQGRGFCPGRQDAAEPFKSANRHQIRRSAAVAVFAVWICLIVAAHSFGQWMRWWN
jgi:hypothetical protein